MAGFYQPDEGGDRIMTETGAPAFPRGRILVFAKAPRAGAVKTRLEPELGRSGALALHETLIRQVCATVGSSGVCPWELWVSAEPEHGLFRSLHESSSIFVQEGPELGARMRQAAAAALERSVFVILLGADCPAVDAAYLHEAARRLSMGEPLVFGPAEDGGYVLLGMRALEGPVLEALFDAMPWGSPDVMAISRQRLRALGQSWSELPLSWDVDRPEDLARLKQLEQTRSE